MSSYRPATTSPIRTGKSFSSSKPVRCSRWTIGRLNVTNVSSGSSSSSSSSFTSSSPTYARRSQAKSSPRSSLRLPSAHDASSDSRRLAPRAPQPPIQNPTPARVAPSRPRWSRPRPERVRRAVKRRASRRPAPPPPPSLSPPLPLPSPSTLSLRGVALPPNSLPPHPNAGPSAHSLAGVAVPSPARTPRSLPALPPPLTLSDGDLSKAKSAGGAFCSLRSRQRSFQRLRLTSSPRAPRCRRRWSPRGRRRRRRRTTFHPDTASKTPAGRASWAGRRPSPLLVVAAVLGFFIGDPSRARRVAAPSLASSSPPPESFAKSCAESRGPFGTVASSSKSSPFPPDRPLR